MRRYVPSLMLGLAALLASCGDSVSDAPPGNKAAEIDALAINLTNEADNWRDEVDNREAAAEAAEPPILANVTP